jgi:hypothetical protein
MENPPKKFFRLAPGREVRLRYAYFITCREVVKNAAARLSSCAAPTIRRPSGGNAPDGRKVKATLHWVSAAAAIPATVHLYNPLFLQPDPPAKDLGSELNPQSLEILRTPASSLLWRKTPANPCSSNARAISVTTLIQRPRGRCSIAPSDCATATPKLRAQAENYEREQQCDAAHVVGLEPSDRSFCGVLHPIFIFGSPLSFANRGRKRRPLAFALLPFSSVLSRSLSHPCFCLTPRQANGPGNFPIG